MAGKFAFGEFFDDNRTLVNGWIFNPHGMRGRASAFDYPLRFILAALCNNPGRFNHVTMGSGAAEKMANHRTNIELGLVAPNEIVARAPAS